jgi:O-antigen/teichoic acid export membrane protein
MLAFWNETGRDGATYLAAEVVAKGGIYILFVWLATVLTVDDFGLLNVFVALLTMIAVGVGLGLPEGLVRFHFVDTDFRAVLAIAIGVPLIAAVVLFAAVLPSRDAAAGVLNIPPGLLLLALGSAPLVILRQEWLGVLRARQEPGHYFLIRLIEPLAFLAVVVSLFATGSSLGYRDSAVAYAAAIGAAAAYGFYSVALRGGLRWDTRPLKRLLLFSFPMVAHGLAMAGLTAFDQLVLQHLLGEAATGTYAFAYRFAMAMSLLVFGFGAAWGPLVLRRLQEGEEATLAPLANTAFQLLVVCAVILAWTVPAIAGWLAGERYSGALHLIPLVVYAYLWLGVYSLAVAHLYFRNRSGRLAAASGAAFLINAVLNYLTIPTWGATAAATTTVISYMLLSLFVWSALAEDRVQLPWARFAFQSVLAAPLVLSASLFFS